VIPCPVAQIPTYKPSVHTVNGNRAGPVPQIGLQEEIPEPRPEPRAARTGGCRSTPTHSSKSTPREQLEATLAPSSETKAYWVFSREPRARPHPRLDAGALQVSAATNARDQTFPNCESLVVNCVGNAQGHVANQKNGRRTEATSSALALLNISSRPEGKRMNAFSPCADPCRGFSGRARRAPRYRCFREQIDETDTP
jgi:hypothetical protein